MAEGGGCWWGKGRWRAPDAHRSRAMLTQEARPTFACFQFNKQECEPGKSGSRGPGSGGRVGIWEPGCWRT